MLTWKLEDGPEDAPDGGSPDDVGPAWVVVYENDVFVSDEKAADGEWITRAEAERLADEKGWGFHVDDCGRLRVRGFG